MKAITVVQLATLARRALKQLPVIIGSKPGSQVEAFVAIGQLAEACDKVLGKEVSHGEQAGGTQPPAGSQKPESMESK